MTHAPTLFRGTLLLPDSVLPGGEVRVASGRITTVGPQAAASDNSAQAIDAGDGYIAPGFVDLHVHGGDGADFMDGTDDAFTKAITSHARHGTTSMAITTTVARHDQIMTVLETTRRFRQGLDKPVSSWRR